MRSNKSRDTKPEVEARRLLHRRGLRFRKSFAIEFAGARSTIDVAFPRLRLAVFIDGCFWHSCPEHGHIPRSNVAYWSSKLTGNVERDRKVDNGFGRM
ncbi:MAG: very short patch repair endonuclease [Dehalococcoidia bacterium]|nr:very short patch repair endonuclease [Dehalococcoidia bacterium]